MTFGIICALDEELSLIRERMENVQAVELYGSTYCKGTIAGKSVVAVCCSIGTINAAVCTLCVIREFGADCVINAGIAGSMCRELNVMDVVISDSVAFHDADLDIIEKYYPYKRVFEADKKLVELCVAAIEQLPDRSFAYKTGLIASGDRFVESAALKQSIAATLSPLCVEMEGAAVGQVAFMSGKPFLVIRTLSDNADEDATTSYDNFIGTAAKNSAQIVLEMISRY